MAFENVFTGIDFQAPNKLELERQKMMLDQLGQAVVASGRAEDRALKERQLELKAQAARDKAGQFNLKKGAEKAAFEISMGGERTPERMAAIQAYSQMQQAQFNPVTGDRAPTFEQQSLGGRAPAPQAPQGIQAPQGMQAPGMNLPVRGPASFADDLGGMLNNQLVAEQAGIPSRPDAITADLGLQVQPGATPRTMQATQEASIDIQKQQAIAKISESKAEREFQLKKQRNRPAQERALFGAAQEWGNINNNIDKAIKQVSPWTTGMGSWLAAIPGTQAKDLTSTIDTISGDAAFTKLLDMKKAGGTLGAISATEMDLLKSSVANLETDQSGEQLAENLMAYKGLRQQSFARIAQAYQDEYGEVPEDIALMMDTGPTEPPQAPAAPQAPQMGGLSPEEQSELELLRKKYGR